MPVYIAWRLNQHIATIDAIIILVHVVLFCYSVKRGMSRFLVMALTPGLTDGSKRERNRTHPPTIHTHYNYCTQILAWFSFQTFYQCFPTPMVKSHISWWWTHVSWWWVQLGYSRHFSGQVIYSPNTFARFRIAGCMFLSSNMDARDEIYFKSTFNPSDKFSLQCKQ